MKNNAELKILLNNLTKLHPKYIDLSLNRILKLLEKLENPHLKLPPTIHIAGTNGKGSTLSFLKQILMKNGYKVHCYISPHIQKIEERFFVSNKIISQKKLINTLKFVKKINNNEKITFFEITTAAAFYLFSQNKADFLILETGLGGKFDATNVIKKTLINIITPISLDHMEFLGKNLNKIAEEKLGIIKPFSEIIISKQKNTIKKHIKKTLKNNKNEKFFFNSNFKISKATNKNFFLKFQEKEMRFRKPALEGDYQIENASTSIIASLLLKKKGYKIRINSINKALINTKWPGRLENIKIKKIPIYLDGSHNIEGAEQLNFFLKSKNKKVWVILGMMKNKNLIDFLKIIKNRIEGVIAIKIPKEKNSFDPHEIFLTCNKLKIKCIKQKNILSSLNLVENNIKPELLLITGSLYLVGKIRNLFV